MSGWGCPHEVNGICSHVNNLTCDPGMKGCVLYGRYRFANDDKNDRWKLKQARAASDGDVAPSSPESDTSAE